MSDELNEQMNNMSVFEENFTRTDYDSSSSSIDDDSKKTMIEDRIILNVGGIKYETFRSTLTAYPDTLLGIMFSERNKEMLHPTNVNEYFFDRDGYIFRYILQYYRTGQVHWPEFSSPYQVNNSSIDLVQGVTKTFTSSPSPSSNNLEGGRMDNLAGFGGTSCPTLPFTRAELEQELLFFLIPTKSDDDLIESLLHEETSSINSTQSLTFANKAVVDNVNGFLYALKEVMYCVASLFEKKIMITFYHDRQQPIFKLIPPNPNILVNELAPFNEKIKSILIPYAGVGYTLLMNFENEIEAWMKEEIKELKWTMEKPGGLPNRFVLHLNFNDKFLKQQILKNSLLAKVINNNNNNNNNINNSNVGGSSSGSGSGIGIGLGIGNGSGNGNGIGSSYSNTVSGPPPMMVPTSNHSSATSGIGNTLGNGSTTNFAS